MTCKTKNGFTLVELLVVIGLMAMLATVSIGGYNAAVRGMDERAAKDSVISLMNLAMQRALIDGQPTAVIFSNRQLLAASDDEAQKVVGTAVAVRMAGRVTYASGNFVADEFADWNLTYPSDGSDSDPDMRLYRVANISTGSGGGLNNYCSFVRPFVTGRSKSDWMIETGMTTNVTIHGFTIDKGFTGWRAGDPYGFEIGSLQLPVNYMFGTSIPSQPEDTHAGAAFFSPGSVDGNKYRFTTVGSMTISALRPGSGGLTRQTVHTVSASDFN